MGDEEGEQRRKKARLAEYREYDKVLQTLDHSYHHDLAAHLLNVAHHRAKQRQKFLENQGTKRRRGPPTNGNDLTINDTWTAWPLPVSLVHRPTPIPSSSANVDDEHQSDALHAEIEAAILRAARSRIQSEGGTMSANEHAPYYVTQEITRQVMTKFSRLLQALGRVKYQQIDSERMKRSQRKSRWDEIVTMAGIIKTVDSPETMERIQARCDKLFREIPRTTEMERPQK